MLVIPNEYALIPFAVCFLRMCAHLLLYPWGFSELFIVITSEERVVWGGGRLFIVHASVLFEFVFFNSSACIAFIKSKLKNLLKGFLFHPLMIFREPFIRYQVGIETEKYRIILSHLIGWATYYNTIMNTYYMP